MKIRIFFLIVLLISGFFLFFNACFSTDTGETDITIGGEDEDEEPPCEPCPCGGYYYCTGGCDGELHYVTPGEPCCGGSDCEDILVEDCHPWQMCDAGSESCYCLGECLKTPAKQKYYNNPTYSDQSSKDYGNKNIYLPVKLDWDDVEGWDPKGIQDGPQSYKITIGNTTKQSLFPQVLGSSEYIPLSCLLKSNSSHTWKAQACCSTDGQNCGSESTGWEFSTNITPELVSPLDPDWVGAKSKEMVPIPCTLDWCDVKEAKSYFLKIDRDGKLYYPFTIENDSGLKSKITLGTEVITKFNTYDWQIATCLNDNWTKCGVGCSSKESGQECGDYSQEWKITTGPITLPAPDITSPKSTDGIPVVNFYSNLGWKAAGIEGSMAYRYEIYKEGLLVATSSVLAVITSVSFETFWEDLEFNQTYSWKIRSCWDEKGADCEGEATESTFKTTGTPPTFKETLSGPINGAVNVLVPTNLNWDDMPGAASYYYEISPLIPEEKRVAKISEVLVDYPVLGQGKNYQWQVKTCADREGKFCGEPASQSFTTVRLAVPTNPLPENGGKLSTTQKNVKWDEVPGANFYQYNISQGKAKGISPANSAFLPTEKLDLGSHAWQVRACLDKDCEEAGLWSNWSFTLVQREDCETGFVPCSRDCDVSETSWNERESCGFKHIFLIFKNILDFLLWRLAPIILVLLVLGSGVIFYFSMGAPATIINVKGIWKSAGIGFAVIFLSWNILNFVLNLLGFAIKWWEFPF